MRTTSDPVSTTSHRVAIFVSMLFFEIFLVSCGGGGSSGTITPPPPAQADFTLALNPQTASVAPGGTTTTVLSATAVNGFAGSISIQIAGLPTGVSVAPQGTSLTPGTPMTLTISAPKGTLPVSAMATVTGTSSTLTHAVNLQVSVTGANTGTATTRTKYVRTDSTTEYFLSVNTHWVIFHSPTSRFFSADPYTNQVFAIDSTTETEIAAIEVPGAYSVDESPDHSNVFVGTLIGDVYVIDPVALKVKKRYLSSEIGPYGFQSLVALALADGRLALLGAAGGIPSVDGSSSIAVWNPSDNSISIYGSPNTQATPASPLCNLSLGLHIFGFALSADRNSVFTGGGTGLCKLNASTGQFASVGTAGNSSAIVVSPDGRYIALEVVPSSVELIDAQSLNQIAQFAVNGDASNLLFSADSSTLFLNSQPLLAYNVNSHQQIGWLPNLVVTPTSGGLVTSPINSPFFGAIDNSGLIGGPLEQGFGFLDTNQLRTGPIGTTFSNAYLNPATGPVSGGTVTEWPAFPSVNDTSKIFFGYNPASSISNAGNFVSVRTPAGQPGPADVYVFTADGGMQLVPDGFSYGPTILQVTTDLATAEGGGNGAMYGYGFGPGAHGAPANLTITVAGQPATIQGVNPNAYNVSAQPFLLEAIYFTIPPGTAGSAADVAVTTPSGTAVARGALTYLPALTNFPLAGASLVQGVYDPIRDVYYFTDTSKIQVFSRTQGKWLNPMAITPPAGTSSRLWGISLSPNSSKLAVADAGSGVVYLINPASPGSVKTFTIAPAVPAGVLVFPAGVAVTDSGIVYLTVDVQGGTGFHNFLILNTNNGALTDLGIDGPGFGAGDFYLKTAVSADNTRAYFNDDGYIFNVDTVTGKVFNATISQGCCYGDYDLTLAPNQVQFEASSYLYDADLNGKSFLTANHRESEVLQFVYGTKLSTDGSLLFQPTVQGIAVFDGRVGRLLSQIAFPTALSTNYDALVTNGKDNIVIAITGTSGDGIAVVDLTSLPEPPPLPYAAVAAIPAVSSRMRKDDRSVGAPSPNERQNGNRTQLRAFPHVTNTSVFPHK